MYKKDKCSEHPAKNIPVYQAVTGGQTLNKLAGRDQPLIPIFLELHYSLPRRLHKQTVNIKAVKLSWESTLSKLQTATRSSLLHNYLTSRP